MSTFERNVKGLLGTKLGMTQLWDENNKLVPVTVVAAATNVVTQVRQPETDGYAAVQVGYGEIEARKVNKPEAGHFAKAGVTPRRHVVEIRTADGRFVAESGGGSDAFGHAQLGGVAPYLAGRVQDALGLKVHWAVPDYLQRSARHIASKTDLDQAIAVGRAAVRYALEGRNATMPAVRRVSASPYRWTIEPAPLTRVANREKKMPGAFLRRDGYGITAAARRYLQPLVRGEAWPPYRDGLPAYVSLKNMPVAKKLPDWAP